MTYIIIFITAIISILCFKNSALFERLSLKPYRVIHNKEWYRVITHLFVHGDYMHLIINMFVLLSFGQYIEQLFKSYAITGTISSDYLTYILLYLGGGVAASIPDLIYRRNNPYYNSIGASGAVSAVLFASIFFNPWNKLYLFAIIPIPGIVFGVMYILYSQYMDKRGGTNVNHRAHLWGAIYGFLFPLLMNPRLIEVFLRNITQF